MICSTGLRYSYDFRGLYRGENQIGETRRHEQYPLKSTKTVLVKRTGKQGVHLGDKLFTGDKSSAQIRWARTSFSLGENSLVEFRRINDQNLADFQSGTYRLFSNGRVKIAINGKVVEIDADNSEFQIVVNGKNDISIKTLKGGGAIKMDGRVAHLNSSGEFTAPQARGTAQASDGRKTVALSVPIMFVCTTNTNWKAAD